MTKSEKRISAPLLDRIDIPAEKLRVEARCGGKEVADLLTARTITLRAALDAPAAA